MSDANRRKYLRVNYPCQLTMWLDNGGNETIMANTSNISIGGMCVYLNQDIDLGTKIDVQLNFDTASSFKCQGTVVRSIRENDSFYNIGIQFVPLDEIKTAFLNTKIAKLIVLEQRGKV